MILKRMTNYFHRWSNCSLFIAKLLRLVSWLTFRSRSLIGLNSSRPIARLNSGFGNRNNFFLWAIFLFSKSGNESVNRADSGNIKIFLQFPGNCILKYFFKFQNCVGGVHMRGRFTPKITFNVSLITPVIFICNIGGIGSNLPKPTQFQPTLFQFFGRFFI